MPNTNFVLLDKEICLAEFLRINPIIVINKIDLDEKKADEILSIYTKTGYTVIKTEAETGRGLDELKIALRGHTTVLAGSSGVRKINYNK